MKLTAISSLNSNQKSYSVNNSFRASYLKNIEGNFCACCGHPMITYGKISKLWAKITSPISKTFMHKNFDIIKNNYPIKVSKTLADATNGMIKLNIDWYIDALKKKLNKIIKIGS